MPSLSRLPEEICLTILEHLEGHTGQSNTGVILDPHRQVVVESLKALRLTDRRWATLAASFLFARMRLPRHAARLDSVPPLSKKAAKLLTVNATPMEQGNQPISQIIVLELPALRSLEITKLKTAAFIHLVTALYSKPSVHELMLGFYDSDLDPFYAIRRPRPNEARLCHVLSLVVVPNAECALNSFRLRQLLTWAPHLKQLELLGSWDNRTRHATCRFFPLFMGLDDVLPPVKDTLEILRVRGIRALAGTLGLRPYGLRFSEFPRLQHLHLPIPTAVSWLAHNVWPKKLQSLTLEAGGGDPKNKVQAIADKVVIDAIHRCLTGGFFECSVVRYACPLDRQGCYCGTQHLADGTSLRRHFERLFAANGVSFETSGFDGAAWALQTVNARA